MEQGNGVDECAVSERGPGVYEREIRTDRTYTILARAVSGHLGSGNLVGLDTRAGRSDS
jgi:hypothetical protein